MDPATAHFLISPAGVRVLARAREVRALPPHRRVDALRREATAEHVRAALSQDALRCRAQARCPHAERLLFTEEALEQATAWPVAADRATRWPGAPDAPLVDLTAGIGLDTLATAASGRPVVACELDPVRALLLAFNADALGLASQIDVRAGDARTPSGKDWRAPSPSSTRVGVRGGAGREPRRRSSHRSTPGRASWPRLARPWSNCRPPEGTQDPTAWRGRRRWSPWGAGPGSGGSTRGSVRRPAAPAGDPPPRRSLRLGPGNALAGAPRPPGGRLAPRSGRGGHPRRTRR